MTTPTRSRTYHLLSADNLALVSSLVVALTTVAVWLFGLGQHRTLFANSLISTSILFLAFLAFVTVGLYHGVKLRDDVGRLTDRISWQRFPNADNFDPFSEAVTIEADGLWGLLAALLLALVAAIAAVFLVWAVGALLWTSVLVFAAMLYWVFFRALRLVFKNSNRCRGQWLTSLQMGFWHAGLYTVWVYAIIYAAHYLG